MNSRKSKDWATQILKDLNEYEINLTIDEIRNLSKTKWKEIIRVRTKQNALNDLNKNQGQKSRKYKELKLASFLSPNDEEVSNGIKKFIAKVHCNMVEEIKTNFKGEFDNYDCEICKVNECTQEHLLNCEGLIGGNE